MDVDDVTEMTNAELVHKAGEGVGPAPAVRDRAQAELTRRLMESMATSSRRMEALTVALVVLTVVIMVATLVLVIRGD